MSNEPLLSKVGRRNWNCRCCNPDKPEHGLIRQREKRAWLQWVGEYEYDPREETFGCPKGGLSCTCDLAEENADNLNSLHDF